MSGGSIKASKMASTEDHEKQTELIKVSKNNTIQYNTIQYNTIYYIVYFQHLEQNNITTTICTQNWDDWKGVDKIIILAWMEELCVCDIC